MKRQIAGFSPHQNGKVFAVLMAISSLVSSVPFTLLALVSAPEGALGPMSMSLLMLLFMPLVSLVLGYVSVAIGCAVYNSMFKYVGGIEFESKAANGA